MESRFESGRGQPHSKTLRIVEALRTARQRLGVRLSPAAFRRTAKARSRALFLSLLLGISSSAQDWPQFLGPHANGISDETGLLDKWPTNGPPLVWEKKIGTGYGAPSVKGELLVLHQRIGEEEIVEALGAATGKSVWKYVYPSHFVDPYGYNNGPRSSPLLTDERCYTFGAEGKLVCLELRTGKLVWQRDTAADWTVPPAFFGVGSSPILENGLLIVMVGGQPNSGIVALDPSSGKTVWESVGEKNWQGQPMIGWPGERKVNWQTWEKQASYSTPVAATIHGQRHLLCLMRQGLVSLNPTNGAVNFSFWFRSPANDSVNAMQPIVVDDQILISGAYYKIGSVLLRIAAMSETSRSIVESGPTPSVPASHAENSATGGTSVVSRAGSTLSPSDGERAGVRGPLTGGTSVEEIWRSTVLELHWNTPIYVPPTFLSAQSNSAPSGFLYAFSGRNEPDAHFRCVEFKTGKLMWDRDEKWAPHSTPTPDVYGRGSCVMADGKLIVLGEGGLLGLFEVNPKEPKEISRFQVPQLHYPCWAAPILSKKRLYLRSEDRLLCLSVAEKATTDGH